MVEPPHLPKNLTLGVGGLSKEVVHYNDGVSCTVTNGDTYRKYAKAPETGPRQKFPKTPPVPKKCEEKKVPKPTPCYLLDAQ